MNVADLFAEEREAMKDVRQVGAILSGDGVHRYSLTRGTAFWPPGHRPPAPLLLWLMLNPSTANEDTDDQTIRKVRAFTRSSLKNKNGNRGHYYRHDMTDEQHVELASTLHALEGMVVLSGYRSDLYEGLYGAWRRVDRRHMADGARARVESLWLNPAAAAAQRQSSLAI